MANSTNINADFLHEIRSISRTLVLIHKDLQKLNDHFAPPTATTAEEKDKSNPDGEQPVNT